MRNVSRALALVAAAVVCAAISNAFAGSERKLLWTGNVEAKPAGPPSASSLPSKTGGSSS